MVVAYNVNWVEGKIYDPFLQVRTNKLDIVISSIDVSAHIKLVPEQPDLFLLGLFKGGL